MADEDNNSQKGRLISKEGDQLLALALIGFALFSLLSQAPGMLRSEYGVDITNPDTLYRAAAVENSTGAGVRVRTREQVSVYTEPGSGILNGRQPRDASGRIESDAVFSQERYWRDVDFNTGADGWVEQSALEVRPLVPGVQNAISIFEAISALISLLFISGIVYNTIRLNQIRTEEREELQRLTNRAMRSRGRISNDRWEHIMQHVESANENDWRTAILEADIMLDEMLETIGYHQGTVGGKLKEVEPSDFSTLEQAWEAHKARNKIAHKGKEYALTQREAQRIIGLYEEVFEEFRYI